MTVKELIEELQVYVDIGYGWIDVLDADGKPVQIALSCEGEPKIVLKSNGEGGRDGIHNGMGTSGNKERAV